MALLLDVNVLIALIDPLHTLHEPAHTWFAQRQPQAWATCPITENAVLRIVGNPRYPNSPGTPAAVVPALASLTSQPGHVFWPDDGSPLQAMRLASDRLLHHSQVTDSALLALAVSRGGRLVSFDRRLVVDAVPGGRAALLLI